MVSSFGSNALSKVVAGDGVGAVTRDGVGAVTRDGVGAVTRDGVGAVTRDGVQAGDVRGVGLRWRGVRDAGQAKRSHDGHDQNREPLEVLHGPSVYPARWCLAK